MTAATISDENYCNIPGMEVVTLEVSRSETYKSKKFSRISGALFSLNEDVGVDGNYKISWSGQTVTIYTENAAGDDLTCTLLLFGD